MLRTVLACLLASLNCAVAYAGNLPEIIADASNAAPACVTPHALAMFVAKRKNLRDRRYRTQSDVEALAVLYRDSANCVQKVGGDCLAVRWDYAFFQMLVETAYLSFKRPDGKPGVPAKDNNFAGVGAIVAGGPGEAFLTRSDGVAAYLQHLLMYAGVTIERPIAVRTRKVQAYIVPEMKKLGRPATFRDMAAKWTGTDKPTYADTIERQAIAYAAKHCGAKP